MKILTPLFLILIFIGCDNKINSNGFARGSKNSWKIGSQSSVDLVTELDKAWSAKAYNKMRTFLADSGTFMFAEGHKFKTADGFINHVKKQMEGQQEDPNWTYDWAVAVDLSIGSGGEWVNAAFTTDVSKTKTDTSKIHYNEWYYIIENKIHFWRQSRQIILDEE